jgi:hypothetical protein
MQHVVWAASRARGLSLIKIRYADLPPGLHVRAAANGRHTIIYLRPGLTHAERRAALLRARRSASMGQGPSLPPGRVAAAVARDRITATTRNGAAAFRAHPLLLLPPVLIVASATLAFVMLSAVSITFRPSTPGAAPRPAPSQARDQAGLGPSGRYQGVPQVPGGGPWPGSGSVPGSGSGSAGAPPGSGPGRSGSAAPSPGSSGPGSPDSGSPAPPSAGASSSPAAASSAAPSPAPTSAPASPSPGPSPSPSACLNLGLVGICVG